MGFAVAIVPGSAEVFFCLVNQNPRPVARCRGVLRQPRLQDFRPNQQGLDYLMVKVNQTYLGLGLGGKDGKGYIVNIRHVLCQERGKRRLWPTDPYIISLLYSLLSNLPINVFVLQNSRRYERSTICNESLDHD